jgi:hypothetical protein
MYACLASVRGHHAWVPSCVSGALGMPRCRPAAALHLWSPLATSARGCSCLPPHIMLLRLLPSLFSLTRPQSRWRHLPHLFSLADTEQSWQLLPCCARCSFWLGCLGSRCVASTAPFYLTRLACVLLHGRVMRKAAAPSPPQQPIGLTAIPHA